MLNKKLNNLDLSNYGLHMSLITFLSSFSFKTLSFISGVTATPSLNFRFTILFSLVSISTSFQFNACPLSLRCCHPPVIFLYLFHYLCLFVVLLSSNVLAVSLIHFLLQEKVILCTNPQALQLFKGFVAFLALMIKVLYISLLNHVFK